MLDLRNSRLGLFQEALQNVNHLQVCRKPGTLVSDVYSAHLTAFTSAHSIFVFRRPLLVGRLSRSLDCSDSVTLTTHFAFNPARSTTSDVKNFRLWCLNFTTRKVKDVFAFASFKGQDPLNVSRLT